MELAVLRYDTTRVQTVGALFEVFRTKDGELRRFLCQTLEDTHRPVKIYGETRIPAGRYEVKLRTIGGHHAKYSNLYPDIHKGMLHITNVPGFEGILVHTGSHRAHTMGCLLVGDNVIVQPNGDKWITRSRVAYQRIYPPIADALARGERVYITFTDFDDVSRFRV